MSSTSSSLEKQNVKDVSNLFTQYESFIDYTNMSFKEKKDISVFFEIDSDIHPKPLEHGIEFHRSLKKVVNETEVHLHELQKIVEASYPGIASLDAEFILGEAIGCGKIVFDNNIVFEGLINKKNKQPYLLGIYSEKAADGTILKTVQLDMGLEFGISAWSVTKKPLSELLDFILEQSKKGHLSKTLANMLVNFCSQYDSQDETESVYFEQEAFNYTESFLDGSLVKDKENNPLLDLYSIRLDRLKNPSKPFKLVEKNTLFAENMSLDKMSSMAVIVADHYRITGERLYDLETVAHLLSANFWEDTEQTVLQAAGYDPKKASLYIKLPTPTIGNLELFNKAKFYACVQGKCEPIKNLEIEYLFASDSGRASEFFSNRTAFYTAVEKANRWTGSTLYICATDVTTNRTQRVMWFSDYDISKELYDRLF